VKSNSGHFLDGGGEMAGTIRAYDWSKNPLGFPDAWPLSLKTAVSMALNSKFPKCVIWGPALIAIPNDAFRPILGNKPSALGRSFRDIWDEAWDVIGPIAERAFAGSATFIEDFPLVVERFGYAEQAYFTFCYSPIRDENGVVQGMMDTVIETTGKMEAQRQARLLNGELEHRIKNTLSIVTAIVGQTLRLADSAEQALETLELRIAALARAQSPLTGSNIGEADIEAVIRSALEPFTGDIDRIRVQGPAVMLSSKQSLTLSLAIHELATNALKYGALSNDTGRIVVAWSTGRPGSEDGFDLTWHEMDGPAVGEPSRKGFGSRILERALPQVFSGNARLTYPPVGLRLELKTQMRHLGGSMDVEDGYIETTTAQRANF